MLIHVSKLIGSWACHVVEGKVTILCAVSGIIGKDGHYVCRQAFSLYGMVGLVQL